jgi:hypothetical protein
MEALFLIGVVLLGSVLIGAILASPAYAARPPDRARRQRRRAR